MRDFGYFPIVRRPLHLARWSGVVLAGLLAVIVGVELCTWAAAAVWR